MATSRSKTDNSTFGQGSPLPTSILPSRGEVFRNIKLLRIDLRQSGDSPRDWEISNIVLID